MKIEKPAATTKTLLRAEYNKINEIRNVHKLEGKEGVLIVSIAILEKNT